jgi:membrane fusion protein (multidrug efflux system)
LLFVETAMSAKNALLFKANPEKAPGNRRQPRPADEVGTAPTLRQAEDKRPEDQPSGPPAALAPGQGAIAVNAAPATRSRKKLVLGGLGVVALVAAAWFTYDYITVGRFIVSTDDAYVGADMAIMSPKVPANVAEVPIVENQFVKEGDVLVRLDDGDYKLALDQAAAKLATQNAAVATFDAQIRAAQANETQTRAQLDATNANVAKTEADYERTKPLADRDYTSKATLDAALAARDMARAQSKAGEAAIESAEANIALLKSQRQEAEQVAKELEVAVAKAKRDLSFTIIRAPFDGVIGNRSVQVGDYVTAGKRLLAVVPLDKVYVDANVKETQLAGIKIGDTAELSVDALDGPPIKGVVEGIAPASGSQFSLLPPENATGNFTKIVQRVPIRIAVPATEAKGSLRPGLSVVVDIDTRTAPKDAAPVSVSQANSHSAETPVQ